MAWIVGLSIVLIILGSLFFLQRHSVRLTLVNKVLQARLANTEELRVKGLSGTHTFGVDQAMLFAFDYSGKWGIWMKDMNYPIDVVWLDENKQVIDIYNHMTPNTYPKVFLPHKDAKYIVELPADFARNNYLHLGDSAQFDL